MGPEGWVKSTVPAWAGGRSITIIQTQQSECYRICSTPKGGNAAGTMLTYRRQVAHAATALCPVELSVVRLDGTLRPEHAPSPVSHKAFKPISRQPRRLGQSSVLITNFHCAVSSETLVFQGVSWAVGVPVLFSFKQILVNGFSFTVDVEGQTGS